MQAANDPVGTAQAVGTGAANVGKAIVADVQAKAESGLEGQGEIAGDIILIIAGPSVVGKVVGKAATFARFAKGAEIAEGLAEGSAAIEEAELEAAVAAFEGEGGGLETGAQNAGKAAAEVAPRVE